MDKRITVETDLEDCLNDLHDCTLEEEFINHADDEDTLYGSSLTLFSASGETLAKGDDAIAMYIGHYVLRQAQSGNISSAYQKLRNGEYE